MPTHKASATWFTLNLGDAMLATADLNALESQLASLYQAANQPTNMLAVYRHQSAGLHCNLVIYLTAAFQITAQLDNATPCSDPLALEVSFLAGNQLLLNQP